MTVIEHADSPTLVPWCQKNIAPGSLIMTDGSASYNPLTKLGYGLRKIFASHKGVKTGDYLPLVHLIISNLKRWIMGTHKGAVRKHHLQAYLNEFTFRFNRRFWRGPAFIRILTMATDADERPEYETLYGVKDKEEGAWVHPNPRPPVSDAAVLAVTRQLMSDAAPPLRAWMRSHLGAVLGVIKAGMEAAAAGPVVRDEEPRVVGE